MENPTPQSEGPTGPQTPHGRWRWLCGGLLWVALIAVGMVALAQYSQTPGAGAAPPPASEVGLTLSTAHHTLVMAVHPKCPCTRATMYELERLVRRCGEELDVVVLVYQPTLQPDWDEPDPFGVGSRFIDARVEADLDGETARKLGTFTSGAVVLYASDGTPAFWGGITAGRGHAGDNLGSDAILRAVRGQTPRHRHTAVFGCALVDSPSPDQPGVRPAGCPLNGDCHE